MTTNTKTTLSNAIFGSLIAAILLLLAGLLQPQPTHAVFTADSFVCDSDTFMLSTGDNVGLTMTLDQIDVTAAVPAFTNLVPTGIIPYRSNAIGYDSNTGFLYGVDFVSALTNNVANTKNFVEIKNDGNPGSAVFDLNAALSAAGRPDLNTQDPASAAYTSIQAPAGAVYDGTYYGLITTQINGATTMLHQREAYLYTVNLTTMTFSSLTQMTYTNYTTPVGGSELGQGGPHFGDIAIDPATGTGYYFDRLAQQMSTIDLATAEVTVYGTDYTATTELISGGAIAFTDSGRLFMYGENDATVSTVQDTLYEVDVATGTLTPFLIHTDAFVADGTSCTAQPGSISGNVQLDAANVTGATLTLLDDTGAVVNDPDGNPVTATTDATGNYSFTGLPPADYQVRITETTVGTNIVQTVDYDSSIDGLASSVTVAANIDTPNVDFAYVTGANISGTAWVDTDQDFVVDDGETLLADVTATLYDASDNQIAQTTTDADGNYTFGPIAPGSDYRIVFTASDDYAALADADNDSVLGTIAGITLISGQVLSAQNASFTDSLVDTGLATYVAYFAGLAMMFSVGYISLKTQS